MVATEHMWLLSICGVASLHCTVNVRCRPEFKDSVWKKECNHMINNFLYWLNVEIDINILGELYIKINFTCFSLFFYLATGNFKITYVPHIIFLLDSAALGPSLAQGSGYLFQLEGQMETPWQQPWGWQEPWQRLFLPVSYTGENQLITSLWQRLVPPLPSLFVLSDSPENFKYIWGEVSSLVLQWKRVVSHQSRRNLRP